MKLEIRDLHVAVEGREVIKGVNLTIREGEFHVLMGPNGSGKTTLSKAIMGHPKMKVTKGDILVDGKSILGLPADKRAKLGIFLEFQNPVEIEGLGVVNFLNSARSSLSVGTSFKDFMEEIRHHGEEAAHQGGDSRQVAELRPLRRREEEDGDTPDAAAEAEDGDTRRARLRARRRRGEDRGQEHNRVPEGDEGRDPADNALRAGY